MPVLRDANEPSAPRCATCGGVLDDPTRVCPHCGAGGGRSGDPHVRTSDLEPYTALLYIGRLFKVLSILIVLSIVGEFVLGVLSEGPDSLGTFLGETMRLFALAGLLWAGGDIVRLMIDAGHDMRLSRILLGRISAHFQRPSSSAPAPSQRDGRRAS
jgi:hypothetical protein